MGGLIRSEDDYRVLLDDLCIERPDVVAVDTETTGLHPYHDDELRGISVAYELDGEVQSWYVPVSHPDSFNVDPKRLIMSLATVSSTTWHHGDFDWAFLAQQTDGWFMPPERRHYDTQVGAWLLDENQRTALDVVEYRFLRTRRKAGEKEHLAALRRGPLRADLYREARTNGMEVKDARIWAEEEQQRRRRDWATFTAEDIAHYAAMDAEVTLLIAPAQLALMEKREDTPLPTVARENRVQRVIYEVSRAGVLVDHERMVEQRDAAERRRAEIEKRFEELDVTLTKPAQVANLVYDEWGLPCYERTAQGGRSVNRAALEAIEAAHPGVGEILEWRRLQKAMTAFYDPILRSAEAKDGRVHSHLSSCRTVTGRWSSSDPNMQTIPRDDVIAGLKHCFIATPGFELWEFDLSQAELRVMASVSKDRRMMHALDHGDLHDETASSIFGSEFTGLQRRLAKNLNFGFAYGIGPRKFATYMAAGPPRVPITEDLIYQASVILDGFRQSYPELVGTMEHLEKIARKWGYVPNHKPGRYRRFRSFNAQVPFYTALNFVVQGGIAEIMKDVMLEAVLENAIDGRVVLQVHDSLWVEVLPGSEELVQQQLQRILDDVRPAGWMHMVWDRKRLGDPKPESSEFIDIAEGQVKQ